MAEGDATPTEPPQATAPATAAETETGTVPISRPNQNPSPAMAETVATPTELLQATAPVTATETETETETVPPPTAAEEDAAPLPGPDSKRKLGEMEGEEVTLAKDAEEGGAADRVEVGGDGEDAAVETEAKRSRVDGEGKGEGEVDGPGITQTEMPEPETSEAVDGEVPVDESTQPSLELNVPKECSDLSQEDGVPSSEQQDATARIQEMTFCKIEIPHSKVGLLIGKSGETINCLQITSGAKIQIARDDEADLNSSSRPVELTGSVENINKAEQLIKDVIAGVDAGGSATLIAKGFGNPQSGAEQVDIYVSNDKVGLVIGKGGETIRTVTTKSGAHIQLIPQQLRKGDLSKERKVRLTGNWKQIEVAKRMIMKVISQPRGPGGAPQWGSDKSCEYPAGRGINSRNPQYHQPRGGVYSMQAAPRGGMGAGWDQTSGGTGQVHPRCGGYDYYASYNTYLARGPGVAQSPMGYRNRNPEAPGGYGPHSSYPQSAPGPQSYMQGYSGQRYNDHMKGQQYYAQQSMISQPVFQSYPPQQGYGLPMPTQHGATTYQGAPTQQPYAQGSTVPPQPGPGYGQPYEAATGGTDGFVQSSGGYQQPASHVASAYPQQGMQPGISGQYPSTHPGYTDQAVANNANYQQPASHVASTHPQQGMQPGVYGQYPSTQPGYTDQAGANNANYGYYRGTVDATAYGNNQPAAGYGSAPGVDPVKCKPRAGRIRTASSNWL